MKKILGAAALILLFSVPAHGKGIKIKIPFTMNNCNIPVVRVKIKGATLIMALDTGASTTFFDSKLRQYIPEPIVEVDIGTTTGSITARVPVTWTDLEQPVPCEKVHGLIGQNIFTQFRQIVFDYKEGLLIFKGVQSNGKNKPKPEPDTRHGGGSEPSTGHAERSTICKGRGKMGVGRVCRETRPGYPRVP